MDAFLINFGLNTSQVITMAVVAAALAGGWYLLRSMVKVALLPFRIGCIVLVLIMVVILVINMMAES